MSMREDMEMLQAGDAVAREVLAELLESQHRIHDKLDNTDADLKDLKRDMFKVRKRLDNVDRRLKGIEARLS